ncbi:MAG: dioxygenase family protein [Chromatiales bacterium]
MRQEITKRVSVSKRARRLFLYRLGALPLAYIFAGWAEGLDVLAGERSPTPGCADDDKPTPPQMEGPFFKPHSPQRTSLREPSINGTPLVLAGLVLTVACEPVAGALLEFWHANDQGDYDNDGFRLRGHQFTDIDGRYRLETVMPGLYPFRTRHIHVKVQTPNNPVLTTQLYFPGEPRNQRDFLFNPRLVMALGDNGGDRAARYDFVLKLG